MALVTYITGNCPGCGSQNCFGNVGVFSTHVSRGCSRCRHHERVPLPRLTKKVLYLDQFFFSHAFRGGNPRFLEAARRIERLASLQLLVVPYSSIHEDETHQWERHEELTKFIRAAARGNELVPAYDVEETQVIHSFRSWLDGGPPEHQLELDDALDGDVHDWENYFYIQVGRYMGDIDLIRDLKRQSVEGLVGLFDGWEKLTTTFEEDLQEEYTVSARGYTSAYFSYAARVMNGDLSALLDSPIASMVVEAMLRLIPRDIPPERWLPMCGEFFRSSHYKETPYHWISAHMFTTLKAMVKNDGAFSNRERALLRLNGFFYDVKHIATYTPYVDAIMVDQPMAELVARPTVALEARYGTRVFSRNKWDAFLAWLDDVETTGMTDEHRAALQAAYPTLEC